MEQQNPYETPTGNLSTGDEAYGEIKFFSPNTRIGRIRYLAHLMLVMLGFYVFIFLFAFIAAGTGSFDENSLGLIWLIIVPPYIFLLYCSALFMVQRLHDLNASGWWWLLSFVPFVNFFFVLWIIFAPGTKGPNDYGLRPPPNKTWHWIMALLFPVLVIVGILAALAVPAYQDYMRRAEAQQMQSQ